MKTGSAVVDALGQMSLPDALAGFDRQSAVLAGLEDDAEGYEAADAVLHRLEQRLIGGTIATPQDAMAKLSYIQRAHTLDPALVTGDSIATLVDGLSRLFGLPRGGAAAAA